MSSVITEAVKKQFKEEYDNYSEDLRLKRLAYPKGIEGPIQTNQRGDYVYDSNGDYVRTWTPIEDTMSFDEWLQEKFTRVINSHLTSFASQQINGYKGTIESDIRGRIIDFLESMLTSL